MDQRSDQGAPVRVPGGSHGQLGIARQLRLRPGQETFLLMVPTAAKARIREWSFAKIAALGGNPASKMIANARTTLRRKKGPMTMRAMM